MPTRTFEERRVAPGRARRRGHVSSWTALAMMTGAAACAVPTDLPRFNTVWEAVLLRDSVSTVELLPESVELDPAGGFRVGSFVSTSSVRLGEVCEFCTCFDGPIPELDILPYDWRLQLPPRLLEADVQRGGVRVVLHNETGFDVLDDGEGHRGFFQIELVDTRTETVFQAVHIDQPFPDRDSLEIGFDLAGLTVHTGVVARVSGKTPGSGCDAVPLTTESGFRADVYLEDLETSRVLAIISDADLALFPREVDLPAEIGDRLRPGEAVLRVEVDIDAHLPVPTEFGISLAANPLDLFTGSAALYTPVVVPGAPGAPPATLQKTYVVDVAPLEGSDRVHLATRNRLLGSPVIELLGSESLHYAITLHAEIPVR